METLWFPQGKQSTVNQLCRENLPGGAGGAQGRNCTIHHCILGTENQCPSNQSYRHTGEKIAEML